MSPDDVRAPPAAPPHTSDPSTQAAEPRHPSNSADLRSAPAPELALRRALERIPGVAAARVALEEDACGRLRHALLALEPGAHEHDVRTVACAVLAALGIEAEGARLQLATLSGAAPDPEPSRPPAAPTGGAPFGASAPGGAPFGASAPGRPPAAAQPDGWGPPRTLLRHDIHLRRDEGQITCRVELLHRGGILAGESSDLDTPSGRARAAARATLKAVEGVREGMRLELEGVHFGDFFGRRHLVLSIEATHGRTHGLLTGVVLVTGSAEESGCLATLRAVERWLTR